MDAKDTTRRINRRPGWCALDERKESRSRTFSAVRDTRLPMDQLQTVARHPPVIMMQSLESGAPDPKAQSSNTSLATPSEGSALGFRWLLVPLVLGLMAIWPLSSLRGTSEETPITLPDGVALDLPKDSCAYELGHFLANPSDPYVPRVLVIDRLSFKSGSTDITPKSQKTVLDLSAVLEAFPSAKVRLEGHTDNTGDRGVKKRLSLKRVEAVKALLTKAGVDPSHVQTVGWGDERPIASNDTAEGRAQNRRLEFVILQK